MSDDLQYQLMNGAGSSWKPDTENTDKTAYKENIMVGFVNGNVQAIPAIETTSKWYTKLETIKDS